MMLLLHCARPSLEERLLVYWHDGSTHRSVHSLHSLHLVLRLSSASRVLALLQRAAVHGVPQLQSLGAVRPAHSCGYIGLLMGGQEAVWVRHEMVEGHS